MKTMLISLAWKNIWRNKLRSGMILGAIAIGLFAGTFMTAFLSGWIEHSVISDIQNQLAYIQVHDPGFAANNDIKACFLQDEAMVAKIASAGEVAAVSYRLRLNAMLASAAAAVGVSVKGVDVAAEKAVFTLHETIPDSCGAFLPDEGRMQIVISRKTAEKLKVRLRSKLVLTFQDTGGEMQSLAFRVGGIFKTANAAFDEGTVFVRKSDIFAYTGLPEGAVHEAALMTGGFETCRTASERLQSLLPGLDVQTWDQVQPELGLMLSWIGLMNGFILAIFLLALSFGIVNTMLMAVLERTHELGMLACIGMSKRRIFRMIMLETVFLTGVGSLLGIAAGLSVVGLTARSGIDLTFLIEDQFEDYGFASVVYPVMRAGTFMQIVALVALAGLLSAIYPARKALKLEPLEAIRN
ncbi:MAG: FtsX-like permease family protein [Tannerellaceae bacterium]|jgi:ABC-type lipoprotein release transport system permease subunit|nr:FtsX-like permease family protein [Tannerellaceae bacterium]